MPNEVFVPDGLKAVNNWCAWKLETQKGRLTKVPYICPGERASSSDRSTWSSFDTVTAVLESAPGYFAGYGLMIADGLVFIDVDHCISDDGTMDERGKAVLEGFPESYAEVSQSGHGLHILTKGVIPRGFNNRKAGVETYAAGRFCAYTGNAIQMKEPTEEQDGINYVFNKYSTKTGRSSAGPQTAYQTTVDAHSDIWVIRHASAITGQNGRNFQALYAGDASAYESASEADSALCVLLAFWCNRNPEQIDRIFRQSGLYRPKWERADYRERTINHACDHIPETYSEWVEKQRQTQVENLRNASARQIFEAWEAKT